MDPIEQQRFWHEEIERLEKAIVEEMVDSHRVKTQRERIEAEHRARKMMERINQRSLSLVRVYTDDTGNRGDHIEGMKGPNEFSVFYTRLKGVRDYHKKYPDEPAQPMVIDFAHAKRKREEATAAPPEAGPEAAEGALGDSAPEIDLEAVKRQTKPLVSFSGEEGWGKYLDLNEAYSLYVNVKDVPRIDYLDYVTAFDKLVDIPRSSKNTAYARYLSTLSSYLESFIRRAKPLFNLDQALQQCEAAFEADWREGTFPGWDKTDSQSNSAATAEAINLKKYASAQELEALGLDRLKSGLQALNMKCGGTLEQRASRLFSVKGVAKKDIDPRLKVNTKKRKKTSNTEVKKHLATAEARIYKMASLLKETCAVTRENVERKLARTAEELEEEDEDAIDVGSEGDDDEEEAIYNPKGLPEGWDGKPIPYWLYKLHGLNVSFVCEICGNETYKGPKAFQQHFQEWRHAHGMRRLGIPNTVHFQNVTRINDARALWAKLQQKKAEESFQAAQEEEFEDSQGNVVNKKTYEDLKRQGLL